jgi:hypothetical protein
LQGTPLLATPSSTSSYVVMRTPSENYPDAFDVEDDDCWIPPLPTSELVSTPEAKAFTEEPQHIPANVQFAVLAISYIIQSCILVTKWQLQGIFNSYSFTLPPLEKYKRQRKLATLVTCKWYKRVLHSKELRKCSEGVHQAI